MATNNPTPRLNLPSLPPAQAVAYWTHRALIAEFHTRMQSLALRLQPTEDQLLNPEQYELTLTPRS